MCSDHTFTVTDANGNYMGKIVKERPEGLAQVAKELGTDADNFTLYGTLLCWCRLFCFVVHLSFVWLFERYMTHVPPSIYYNILPKQY